MTLVLTAGTTHAPHVQIDVDSPPAGAETVTVWRTDVSGREWKVRSLIGQPADGATGLDYEAPRGSEASYRPQYFDVSGVFLEWGVPETITLPAPATQYEATFHNPLDPTTSVTVELRGQGVRSLVRPIPAEIMRPAGRSVGVAIFRGPRQGYAGLVLDAATLTTEDELRFDALFGGYNDTTVPILCIRTHPAVRFPPTLFALISSPTKDIPDGADMDDLMWWGLTGDEVAPPPEALITALLSYEDFTVFYTAIGDGDYDEFTLAYADYTAASRDYSIAGTA